MIKVDSGYHWPMAAVVTADCVGGEKILQEGTSKLIC